MVACASTYGGMRTNTGGTSGEESPCRPGMDEADGGNGKSLKTLYLMNSMIPWEEPPSAGPEAYHAEDVQQPSAGAGGSSCWPSRK